MQSQTSAIETSRRTATLAAPFLRYAIGTSALGSFVVAVSPQGVAAILFGETQPGMVEDLRARFVVDSRKDEMGLAATVKSVATAIAAPNGKLDIALDPAGTDFQRKVWQALRRIPVGTTVSYADVAGALGAPRSVRAVAQACGANPIAVLIPCHRVVRSDGALGGYRWGTERKSMLLRMEGAL